MDCLFCKIVAGQIPADIVGRNDNALAFTDISPQAPTHILIAPIQHIRSIAAVRPEHADILSDLIRLANDQADQCGATKSGYRLVANNGPDAGQSVDHLHLHLLAGRKLSQPLG